MALILFFTTIGFLAGLTYIMIKRKIRPGNILTATFLGLLFAGIGKVFRDYYKMNKRRYF
jgi:hypothetical protein